MAISHPGHGLGRAGMELGTDILSQSHITCRSNYLRLPLSPSRKKPALRCCLIELKNHSFPIPNQETMVVEGPLDGNIDPESCELERGPGRTRAARPGWSPRTRSGECESVLPWAPFCRG